MDVHGQACDLYACKDQTTCENHFPPSTLKASEIKLRASDLARILTGFVFVGISNPLNNTGSQSHDTKSYYLYSTQEKTEALSDYTNCLRVAYCLS